ncbi:MAG: hypothetical protein HYU87_00605 [Chloroflexi bacterium]|nr:hypothetical protein [Chloroflexota bacterium]
MPGGAAVAHPVSELQTSAPELVRQARRKGAVPLTRYGKTVAFLVSPETRRRQEDLEQAANRALWAIDIARGMHDLQRGDVTEWDEVYAGLERELAQP